MLTLVNLVMRRADLQEEDVVPCGLALTLSAAAILTYTGWLVGELSYKHMIGVDPQVEEPDQRVLGTGAPVEAGVRRAGICTLGARAR